MAYITAEFKHYDYEITIQVLKPERVECDYKEGRKIDIEIDGMPQFTTTSLIEVSEWIKKTCIEIEKTFDAKGNKLKPLKP